jgi:glycosyltransferase involved in cell wall biosynthesis
VTSLRETIKRAAPLFVRNAYSDLRLRLAAPPLEQVSLHPYAAQFEDDRALRLSLVLPSLSPTSVYGGVATGLDIFVESAKRANAQARLVFDDFDRRFDRDFLESSARRAGVDYASIEICPRNAETQPIRIRQNDIFIAYNWWAALNLRNLIDSQHAHFGGERKPLLYLIQEYEPSFYPMSSTHMFARMAFGMRDRVWAVFNSSELHKFVRGQGYEFEREYVFEPWLSARMKPFLAGEERPDKVKRILIYGRPTAPRNCFPAIVAGLRTWTERYPRFAGWSVVSAGDSHRPVRLGRARTMSSLGKLSLENYALCLQTTAVGISFVASPHPSYPPLEMAHFGVRTLTNQYSCKDLRTAHDNIVSLPDISPDTIADALAGACEAFEASPRSGWEGKSHRPHYLADDHREFLDGLGRDIAATATPYPGVGLDVTRLADSSLRNAPSAPLATSGTPTLNLYTYSLLPYDGVGPARSCVNILENLPQCSVSPILFTPRASVEVPRNVTVKQSLPALLRQSPYRMTRPIGVWTLNQAYERGLRGMDPQTSVAYFWPDPPTSLILEAKMRGIVTVREMINCTRGFAKRILDDVYRSHNASPAHGISDASVDLEEEQLQLYDFVFTPKQAEPGVLAAGVDPARIVPSSFGWEPERFVNIDGQRRSAEFTVLFVGTLCFRKGVPELLKAWKQSGIRGRLILMGSIAREMRPILGSFLNDPSITLMGFQSNLSPFYRDADIFVFPTFEEGGPQVTFEAAGCGLPIITTPMGATRLIKDGVNGLVVPAGDVHALAATMSTLANSPELRLTFGRSAKAAARNFTYQKIGSYRALALQGLLRRDPQPARLEMERLEATA